MFWFYLEICAMKITFLKQHGQLVPYSAEDKAKLDKMADGAAYVVDIKNMDIRTLTQNKALHKYFELLATELNSAGYSVAKTLKASVVWTPLSVKELLWKPIQNAVLAKISTTELEKKEIDTVYDVLNALTAEKFGISILFPSKNGND